MKFKYINLFLFYYYFSLDALADGWPLECQGMPIMHNMTRANVTIIKLENYHVLLLQPWIEHRRYITIQEGDDQWVAGGGSSAMHTICIYGFSVPLCDVV